MPDVVATGMAVRAVLYAIIAALLVRHVWRYRPVLAATAGPRFPGLYWCFAGFLGLAAIEAAVATVAPFSLLRVAIGMASDAVAIVTIERLWRSQDESATRWQTPEGRSQLLRAVEGIEALVSRGRDG